MPQPNRHIEAYIKLAQDLAAHYQQPDLFLARAKDLPPYTATYRAAIWEQVEAVWYPQPQLGWALAAVGEAAAYATSSDLSLQAQASLDHARAANHWFHPQNAKDAARRARLAFEQIDDPFGAAAAEIELFTFTNTFLDTEEVKQRVTGALAELTSASDSYEPIRLRGRLALAFAMGLLGDYDEAQKLLDSCERAYRQQEDPYALARICQIRAGQASLQNEHAVMEQTIAAGLELLIPLGETPFTARLETLDVHRLWVTTGDYGAVVDLYEAAREKFVRMGIDVWVARIDHYIALVRWAQGRLNEAVQLSSGVLPIFARLGDPFSSLGSLSDLSTIELYRGNYETSLDYALQASLIAENYSRWRSYAVTTMNQGWAYFHLGQFQNALVFLERSLDIAHQHNLVEHVIGAEIWLAQFWLALNQPEKFDSYLESAERLARENSQQEFIFEIFEQRVHYWLTHQPPDDFIQQVEEQITQFEALKQSYFAVELKRQLGNFLSLRGNQAKGAELLQSAISAFEEMGRTQKLALSWLNLGDCQAREGKQAESRQSLERSLALSEAELDIHWQAASRVAAIYETAEQFEPALALYEKAIWVLSSIRQNIWQQSLIGEYTQRATDVCDAAVRVAFKRQDERRLLRFIEAAKAHTLNARLLRLRQARETGVAESQELLSRRQRLEERQRAFKDLNPILKRRQRKDLMRELHEFNELLSQQQRRQVSLHSIPAAEVAERTTPETPDLNRMRAKLTQRFGEKWRALIFYLDDEQLTGMLITPDTVSSWQRQLTPKIDQILTHFQLGMRARLEEKDLEIIGEWLLPAELSAGLEPHVPLLIAPHGRLHALPYPALQFLGKPLIEQCVVQITPSITTYLLLTDQTPQAKELNKGLVFAISEFNGRYPPLPAVHQEQQNLLPQLSSHSQIYREEAATWARLQAVTREEQLQSYGFFHFSSHAEFNPQTPLSPLNGLAFADKTVGLDQLQALHLDLPLVTLSACSGLNSHQSAGDEHSGIGISFLEAGARSVVGALWPIEDEAAAQLLPRFYSHYFKIGDSARALALMQREAIRANAHWEHWGILLHIGH